MDHAASLLLCSGSMLMSAPRVPRCPALLAAALALAACADDGAPRLSLEGYADFLSLGEVRCGATSAQTFRLRNLGDADLDYDLFSTLAEVAVEPAAGTIAPGDAVTVTVTAQPPSAALPGSNLQGHLVLRSNTPATPPRLLPLYLKVTGASVSVRPTVDLGVTSPSFGAIGRMELTYRGTDPVNLRLGQMPAPFTLPGPNTFTFQGNFLTDITMPPLLQTARPTESLSLHFTGNLCGEVPSSVQLQALSTTARFRADRTLVDFGEIGCEPKRLPLIVDAGTLAAQTYNVSLLGNAMTFEEPLRGPLSGTQVFHLVTKKDLSIPDRPDGNLFDSAVISGSAALGDVTSVELRGTVRRAVLTVQEGTSFGEVPLGAVALRTVEVHNRGNAAAEVELDPKLPIPRDLTVSPSRFVIPAGQSRPLTLVFNPRSGAPGAGTVLPFTLVAANSCQPLTIVASGTVGKRAD